MRIRLLQSKKEKKRAGRLQGLTDILPYIYIYIWWARPSLNALTCRPQRVQFSAVDQASVLMLHDALGLQ